MFKQIAEMTSDTARNAILVRETHEPLIEIPETDRIKFTYLKPRKEARFARKTVAEKLVRVAALLPDGLILTPFEAYRSTESQTEGWNRWWNEISQSHPDWTKEQVDRETNQFVARPDPLANHHCGGAVDLTIAHVDGTLVDMGSPYPDGSEGDEVRSKLPMFASGITPEQAASRTLLREAMAAEEFVFYPAEWWHYCWGDRMWAVHTQRTECVYGPAESP